MSFFTNFYRWLFNIPREIHTFPIKEDLIERDETVRELVKQLQSRDAQLSNISAQNREKALRESEVDINQEAIKELIEQKRRIDEKKYLGSFSWKKFWYKYLNDKKFRGELEICDKDDSIIFGKFGDFVVLPDGRQGITDSEDNLIGYGNTLRHFIWKPESLDNQMKRKRILLSCDKNHLFFPDIEEILLPECTYVNGKIRWAKVSEKPLKQLIIDREKRIAQDSSYIERLEQTKAELVKKNRVLEREITIARNNKETETTELSKAINLQKQYYKRIGTLQKKIVILTGMKESLDEMRRKLEGINKRLIEKIDEMGAKTKFREVLGTVQSMIEWARLQTGDTIIQEKEELPKQTKPGELG